MEYRIIPKNFKVIYIFLEWGPSGHQGMPNIGFHDFS